MNTKQGVGGWTDGLLKACCNWWEKTLLVELVCVCVCGGEIQDAGYRLEM